MHIVFGQLFELAMQNDLVKKNYSAYLKLETSEGEQMHKPFAEEELQIHWKNTEDKAVQINLLLYWIVPYQIT